MDKRRAYKITDDQIQQAALKYKSRSDFASLASRAYNAAWRRGTLESVCAHMAVSPVYSDVRWSIESAWAEASRHDSRAEFKRHAGGAYCFLKDRGLLGEACLHMNGGQNHWHVFELRAVAIRYQTPIQFKKSALAAYQFARHHGVLDAICRHMTKKKEWSRAEVLDVAKQFLTRSEFGDAARGAYKHALLNGYIEEACAHMSPALNGFDKAKSATLYYLRVTTPAGLVLYKIGITNRSVRARATCLGHNGCRVEILRTIPFTSGREARLLERQLHREFASSRYDGEPVLGNGNTELFTRDVLADYL